MKTIKKVHKRSKKVLGRAPNSTYHVKETIVVEDYPGHKVKIEKLMTVDDFTNGTRSIQA